MDYMLTIQIRFPAVDDIDARMKAKSLIMETAASPWAEAKGGTAGFKLQEVFGSKPPRPVKLNRKDEME